MVDDSLELRTGETILAKDIPNFVALDVRNQLHFTIFAAPFAEITFDVGAGGQITAKAHRNGAGDNFGEACSDDDARRCNRDRNAGGQSKRHREPIGEPDDDIAQRNLWRRVPFGMPFRRDYASGTNFSATPLMQ